MDVLKSAYYFDNDQQILKIEFFPSTERQSWYAYVFDENWNDVISSASSISERITETIEFAYETLGIRGRIAIIEDLGPDESLKETVDSSLFHLQALLFSSAILVDGEYEGIQKFGFIKEMTAGGRPIYLLSSEVAGDESCRFL